MQASVVDLWYNTKSILECLRRRQKVDLTCREKVEGIIIPVTGTINFPPLRNWINSL